MSDNHYKIISEQFQTAISDLFECYTGVKPQITKHENEIKDSELSALVTLCDEQIKATASITTSADSAESLADFPVVCTPDWLGELANQLGGRLKNKLNTFGIQPVLSTPTSIQGRALKLNSTGDDHHALRVKFMGGQMLVELAVECDADIQLEPQLIESTSEEGSLELF